jgi:hypothetical protein
LTQGVFVSYVHSMLYRRDLTHVFPSRGFLFGGSAASFRLRVGSSFPAGGEHRQFFGNRDTREDVASFPLLPPSAQTWLLIPGGISHLSRHYVLLFAMTATLTRTETWSLLALVLACLGIIVNTFQGDGEPLIASLALSGIAFAAAFSLIRWLGEVFMKAGLKGRDMSKLKKVELYVLHAYKMRIGLRY